jgi:hypothetical protein
LDSGQCRNLEAGWYQQRLSSKKKGLGKHLALVAEKSKSLIKNVKNSAFVAI